MNIFQEESKVPEKQIRAFYTKDFIRVYQAYSDIIADSVIRNGAFVSPPFSMTRMTWIKPSFLWMMYRSDWGMKDLGQKRILAIDLTHEGFFTLISQGVLNHHNNMDISEDAEVWKLKIKSSDVVIQWDPERDIYLNKLNYRTIQIGLRNKAVYDYCHKWIVDINDLTELTKEIHNLIILGDIDGARKLLPIENKYELGNNFYP
ncbi:DUF4291 domain-containing protein [Gibbsiella greigii]